MKKVKVTYKTDNGSIVSRSFNTSRKSVKSGVEALSKTLPKSWEVQFSEVVKEW